MTKRSEAKGYCCNCQFCKYHSFDSNYVECNNPDASDYEHFVSEWHGCENFKKEHVDD